MKCPRCGSGRLSKQILGWMARYTCHECAHSFAEQIAEKPPTRERDLSQEEDG